MKIKVLTIIIFALLCVSGATGQDIIKKHNGETLEALIVDISPGVIKYRKFDKPHGSVYSIARDQVEMITYQNGKSVSFEDDGEDGVIPLETKPSSAPPKASPLFGWHLALGGSNLYGDIEGSKWQLASSIGATLTLPIGKTNTLLFGFDILSVGCKFEDMDVTFNDGTRVIITNANQDMGYLGLVVMDRFYINAKKNYFIEGGGYGSFLVNASTAGDIQVTDTLGRVESGSFNETLVDFYQVFDFGLIAGLGGRLPLGKSAKWHLTIEARFYYGLSDIANPDPSVYGPEWEDYRESNIYGLIFVGVDIPTKSSD